MVSKDIVLMTCLLRIMYELTIESHVSSVI